MRIYSQNEVFRTAHEYTTAGCDMDHDPVTNQRLKHGVNEVCICCKKPSVELSEKDPEYGSFKQFYQTLEYKAYKCPACGYQFSWYKNK